MTKKDFLFAGQGAQYLGMGRELYDQYDVVKSTFEEASQILGYDVRDLIDNDEEKLNQTRYTQPAILTTSLAIYRWLLNADPSWKKQLQQVLVKWWQFLMLI